MARTKFGKNKKKGWRKTRKTKSSKKANVAVFGHVFSDSCHFCQDMQTEWDILVKRAPFTMNDIGVDHEANIKKINDQYRTDLKADGFPTIFRIIEVNGKKYSVDYYNGSRTAALIMKWLVGKRQKKH